VEDGESCFVLGEDQRVWYADLLYLAPRIEIVID